MMCNISSVGESDQGFCFKSLESDRQKHSCTEVEVGPLRLVDVLFNFANCLALLLDALDGNELASSWTFGPLIGV